jgi:N-acetylmuramoyl-L-alanine amidase
MLVAALFAVATIFFAAESGAQTTISGPLSGKTVVIDPGHGGSDFGATYKFPQGSTYAGTTLYEKDQNLKVAYLLEDMLEKEGAEVYMTRTADVNLSNTQRANKANSFKAADPGIYMLVSIHMNGSTDKTANYTTTLYGKVRKDKKLAEVVYSEGLLPRLGIKGRTPYQFASGVLLKSNMPATIAETVFITNTEEANRLAAGQTDGTYWRQQLIAAALKEGIKAHFVKYPSG